MAEQAGGIRAGRAFVEILGKTQGLDRALLDAGARIRHFGDSVVAVGAKVALAGASIAAPFIAVAKNFADAGSELNDMSARTGLSVESLSELSFAAQQTGSSIGDVEGAIRKMQKALTAGSLENQQAITSFRQLGLSVEQLSRLNPDQQFRAIAKRIAEIKDPTAKVAAAMTIFGKSAATIIPMIDNLDQLTSTARELGIVMSTKDATAADDLGDALDTVAAVSKAAGNTIGAILAPALTEVATIVAAAVRGTISWMRANEGLVKSSLSVVVAVTAVGAALVALRGVLFLVGGPIPVIVAGLTALAAWFLKSTATGQAAMQALGKRFGWLAEIATQAFGAIGEALASGDISLAADILWAGLKLAWLKGTKYLSETWTKWSLGIVDTLENAGGWIVGKVIDISGAMAKGFVHGFDAIADLATMTWAQLKNGLASFADFFGGIWDSLFAGVSKALIAFAGFFKQEWTKLRLLLTGGVFDAQKRVEENRRVIEETTAALAKVDADLAAKRQARENRPDAMDAAAKEVVDRQRAREEKIRKIDETTAGDKQAAGDIIAGGQEARRAVAADAMAAAGAELEAAQAELDRLTSKAEAGKKLKDRIGAAKGPNEPDAADFSPDAIDKGMDKVKTSVTGTFSAAALGRMGVGDTVQQEQLKEQKKGNDQLEKLNKKADQGRLVFK